MALLRAILSLVEGRNVCLVVEVSLFRQLTICIFEAPQLECHILLPCSGRSLPRHCLMGTRRSLSLELCSAPSSWRVNLNKSRYELVIFPPTLLLLAHFPKGPASAAGTSIHPLTQHRKLGVILDSSHPLTVHIQPVTKYFLLSSCLFLPA